jgi:hypothetical protein
MEAEFMETNYSNLRSPATTPVLTGDSMLLNEEYNQAGFAYNTAVIRKLLSASFNDEELTTFCFDHFLPVYQNFADGLKLSIKIQLLLDHCLRYQQFENLLTLIRSINPAQYALFSDKITVIVSQADATMSIKSNNPHESITDFSRVEIVVDVNLARTTPEQNKAIEGAIVGVLSYTLGIDPKCVHIIMSRRGSLILDLLLPQIAARQLLARFNAEQDVLKDIGIVKVSLQKDLLRCDNCGTMLGLPSEDSSGVSCPACHLFHDLSSPQDLPFSTSEASPLEIMSTDDLEARLRALMSNARASGLGAEVIVQALRDELEFAAEMGHAGRRFSVQLIDLGPQEGEILNRPVRDRSSLRQSQHLKKNETG